MAAEFADLSLTVGRIALPDGREASAEGTCEGQMACSTCHVYLVGGDVEKLPAPIEEEEDMLDFAAGANRQSRLACQVKLTADIHSLDVRMPRSVVDNSR